MHRTCSVRCFFCVWEKKKNKKNSRRRPLRYHYFLSFVYGIENVEIEYVNFILINSKTISKFTHSKLYTTFELFFSSFLLLLIFLNFDVRISMENGNVLNKQLLSTQRLWMSELEWDPFCFPSELMLDSTCGWWVDGSVGISNFLIIADKSDYYVFSRSVKNVEIARWARFVIINHHHWNRYYVTH